MDIDIKTINENFSTTVFVSTKQPKIFDPENAKFRTASFSSLNIEKKERGGLRVRGCFKYSYKLIDGKLWTVDFLDNRCEKVKILEPTRISFLPSLSNLPLITVITVVLNGASTIEETIRSVINQTYPNVEYIIIDGGSEDGTLDIIKKYEAYIDYWVSGPDEGIYDAMNRGVILSQGQWLNFMGADDTFYKDDVVEKIVNFLQNKTTDLIYGNVIFKNKKEIYDGYFPNWKLAVENICHQAIFYNRNVFYRFGLYNLKYPILADYEFNLRCYSYIRKAFLNFIISLRNDDERIISRRFKDCNFCRDKDKLIKRYLGLNIFFIYKIMKILIKIFDKLRLKKLVKKMV